MATTKHKYEQLVLEDFKYLNKMSVLIPVELKDSAGLIKDELRKIEEFYQYFFKKDFIPDGFILKFMTSFYLYESGRYEQGKIVIHDVENDLESHSLGPLIAHEFAHFIDYRGSQCFNESAKTRYRGIKDLSGKDAAKFLRKQNIFKLRFQIRTSKKINSRI